MKTQIVIAHLALVAIVAFVGVGCAKNNGSGFSVTPGGTTPQPTNPIPVNPITPITPVNPGVNNFAGQRGASVAFSPDGYPSNLSILTEYVFALPLNDPKDFAINVDLQDIGGNRYAGSVQIGYTDNGKWRAARFESGTGYNQVSYKDLDKGKSEAEFNKWFVFGGKNMFHGFFQDRYGSIVLVIDKSMDLGDGGPSVLVNGSIWFKMFPTAYGLYQEVLTGTYNPMLPHQSPEKCWFIRVGPYDCRTWVEGSWDSGLINTSNWIYPLTANGYKRLGTFQGLEKKRAFNQ